MLKMHVVHPCQSSVVYGNDKIHQHERKASVFKMWKSKKKGSDPLSEAPLNPDSRGCRAGRNLSLFT